MQPLFSDCYKIFKQFEADSKNRRKKTCRLLNDSEPKEFVCHDLSSMFYILLLPFLGSKHLTLNLFHMFLKYFNHHVWPLRQLFVILLHMLLNSSMFSCQIPWLLIAFTHKIVWSTWIITEVSSIYVFIDSRKI